jgi:hypothetical protein
MVVSSVVNLPTYLLTTIYLPRSCLFSYLSAYMRPISYRIKMKPNINSVELHPQLSNKRHPVDGALVSAGSLWPPSNEHSQTVWTSVKKLFLLPKRSSNIQRQTVSSFNISQPMSFACWPRKCHILLNYFGSCNSLVAWVRSFWSLPRRVRPLSTT